VLEDLSDVVVKRPTEIKVTIPYDYQYGELIARALDLGVPWTSGSLATFLEALAKGHDAVKHVQTRRGNLQRLTNEQLDYFKEIIREGATPSAAVAEMKNKFDVVVTRSYVCHTRTRMCERGEL
jgi:hypothetical protein